MTGWPTMITAHCVLLPAFRDACERSICAHGGKTIKRALTFKHAWCSNFCDTRAQCGARSPKAAATVCSKILHQRRQPKRRAQVPSRTPNAPESFLSVGEPHHKSETQGYASACEFNTDNTGEAADFRMLHHNITDDGRMLAHREAKRSTRTSSVKRSS
jgi:hypothetical protein